MQKSYLIGIVVVIIIVALVGVVLLGSSKSNSGTKLTTIASSTVAATTMATTSVVQTAATTTAPATTTMGNDTYALGYMEATCGPGMSCISQSEADALLGAGTYKAEYSDNLSAVSNELASISSSNQSVFTNNVTATYLVTYNITGSRMFATNATNYTGPEAALTEIVLVSPKAQVLYNAMMSEETGTGLKLNATNATVGGMTYSYLSENSILFTDTSLVGMKNNDITLVAVIGQPVNVTDLATTVSGDMP